MVMVMFMLLRTPFVSAQLACPIRKMLVIPINQYIEATPTKGNENDCTS